MDIKEIIITGPPTATFLIERLKTVMEENNLPLNTKIKAEMAGSVYDFEGLAFEMDSDNNISAIVLKADMRSVFKEFMEQASSEDKRRLLERVFKEMEEIT